MNIFAIGGGEIGDFETTHIDKEIVAASGKDRPSVLFIPTASDDSNDYVNAFHRLYGDKLNCNVDSLMLIDGNCSSQKAKEKILSSDIIYVGGGNTKNMLETWAKYDVDKFLKEALKRGKILSGLSAGSICWFKTGNCCIQSYSKDGERFKFLSALNFINLIHCPHYNEEDRKLHFEKTIFDLNEIGIGIDDSCAVEFKDNFYRILKSNEEANAYKIYRKDDKLITEVLEASNEYRPLSELISR